MSERYDALPPFPNGWFKLCFTDELEVGEVRGVHQFGQDLVVYRGEDGVARVLDAYCPHLGANLGVGGKVEGDTIRCPFHAWRFDQTGTCVEIPYANKIPPRAQLRAWPSFEKNGYVAVWHHALGKPPEFEIPEVPEVSDPDFYLHSRRRWELATHLQDVYENAVDVKHFTHVHEMQVDSVSWKPDGPHVALELDLHRESEEQSTEEGETSFRSFMYGPGLSLTRVTGKMRGVSVQTLTPLDREKIEICHTYYASKSLDMPREEVDGFFLYYAGDWELDFNLWNNKVFRARPPLAEGDGDIGKFRRWYKQFYSEDVKVDVETPGA